MIAITLPNRCSGCQKKTNAGLYAIIERQCIILCPSCRKKLRTLLSEFLRSE